MTAAHSPFSNASSKASPTANVRSVLFATSELTPFVKTGGLADVSASLPAALADAGVDVRIILPAYASVLDQVADPQPIARTQLLGHQVTLLETTMPIRYGTDTENPRIKVWLVQANTLFARDGGPYAHLDGSPWADNALRFAVFCQTIAWIARGGTARRFLPDVLHLNDWQCGLACAYLAADWPRPALVFGIHNLAYQGLFERSLLASLGLPDDMWRPSALEYYGQLSFMKGGLVFADALVAVSPTYAQEIQTPAFGEGLHGLLRERSADLKGILNGIDTQEWDPATDTHLVATYDADHLERKALNTHALRAELGLLPSDQPLIGCIGRLAYQKGIDIVLGALDELVAGGVQFAILGNGEHHYAAGFADAVRRHPGRVAFSSIFDERLAHRIEAGADLFLMPSRYEPCGLNQLFSMRYGTLPIVHRTGGLADTVAPIDTSALRAKRATNGTGFVFDALTHDALCNAVRDAQRLWRSPAAWRVAQRQAMAQNFSWRESVAAYQQVYAGALAKGQAQ